MKEEVAKQLEEIMACVRKAAFEEAAKHLEEHASGYEHSAAGKLDTHDPVASHYWRRQDEAIAYNLREKAAQIRLMK